MELKDKVVVITGGTKGLGKALAFSFLREGLKVVVCSRNEDELKNLVSPVDELRPRDARILGIKADVTKESELQNIVDIVKEKFGRLDIWINNAGIWLPHGFAEDFDMEKVKNMFDVNVFGLMNGSRVAIKFFKKQGSGSIVNIISDSALVGRTMGSMYGASKWAVNGFTKSIREEDKNISVFSIFPGPIKTEIFGKNKPENYEDFMTPDFVANKIVENLKKEVPEEELIIRRN